MLTAGSLMIINKHFYNELEGLDNRPIELLFTEFCFYSNTLVCCKSWHNCRLSPNIRMD